MMKAESVLNPMRAIGMMNPKADKPCGPIDKSARVPEPQHFDCRECHRIIREQLEARVPAVAQPKIEQARLSIMRPED
jgi:hypothetical protein